MKLAEGHVEVRMRSDRLRADLRGVEQGTERTARRMGDSMTRAGRRIDAGFAQAGASLRGFLKVAAGFLALRQLVGMTREWANELERLAKQAKTLGTTPDVLAGLGFASERTTSMSTEQLGKSLERFVKRVGEASAGAGELLPVLKAMGIEASELSKLPLDEQFFRYARAVSALEDRGQALTAVQKAFGDEARALLPLLQQEEQDIRDLVNQGRSLRREVNGAAQAIENWNDAMGTTGQTLKGIGDILAVGILPVLTNVISKWNEWIGVIISSGDAFSALSDIMNSLFHGGDTARESRRRHIERLREIEARAGKAAKAGAGDTKYLVLGAKAKGGGGQSFDTMLGTFNIGVRSLEVLRNIAASNERMAKILEQGGRTLGDMPLT